MKNNHVASRVEAAFLHCLTPLHAGTGSEIGAIDLPIQREGHTHYPKIEASGIKGSFREHFTEKGSRNVSLLFGPEDSETSRNRGSITFSNARILLFPIRSLKGTFVWVTCPAVLRQLRRDLRILPEYKQLRFTELKDLEDENFMASGSAFLFENKGRRFGMLEELVFEAEETFPKVQTSPEAEEVPLQDWLSSLVFSANEMESVDKLRSNLAIIPDDFFRDFALFHTELATRIKIDSKTKTVQDGALFNIEYLPQESVLYSLLFTQRQFSADEEADANHVAGIFQKERPDMLQIGGDASLGKGWIEINYHEGGQNG